MNGSWTNRNRTRYCGYFNVSAGEPNPSDPDMSSLYGLALPLIKHGTALEMVQMERIDSSGYLNDLKALLLTYEGQKPPTATIHEELAKWVKHGYVLVLLAMVIHTMLFGNGGIRMASTTSVLKSISLSYLDLGVIRQRENMACGRGWVMIEAFSPAKSSPHDPQGCVRVVATAKSACQLLNLPWSELRGGIPPRICVIAAGMEEGDHLETKMLLGSFVNLFDAEA